MIQVLNSRVLASGFLLLVLWLGVFYENILAMEAIWRRSDTFAHGYFVLPIVIWLFWRDRSYLLNSNTHTSLHALPFIVGSLVVYLFAYTADINVLGQLSAVMTLIFLIWFALGNQLAWHYKFPLAYLLFLVPMGESFIPELQDITAWFTVEFLKLHGIPVFRDGLYIQIPNGLFEVAVACSGIRYLIASVAVGTLFAYLSYNSFKKQLLFCVFALVLPIIANGVRAYLIVIIAHYSDMKYATGADHLVYGWLFFGLIIMLMFWVGGKFTDPEMTVSEAEKLAKKEARIQHYSIGLNISAVALIVSILLIRQSIPVAFAPQSPNAHLTGLKIISSSNWGITFKQPIKESFGRTEQNLEVYSAQYANLQDQGELISFANKLHDEESWTIIERQAFTINEQKVVFVGLRNIVGKTRSYIYSYKVGQYSTGSSAMTKIYQAVNSTFRLSDYSSVQAVSITNGSDFEQDKALLVESFSLWFMIGQGQNAG